MPATITDREWKLLLDRMKDQDEKLDEILTEVKRTNGRVTKLETEAAIREDRDQRKVRSSDLRRDKYGVLLGAVAVIVGGSGGAELLHLLGWL